MDYADILTNEEDIRLLLHNVAIFDPAKYEHVIQYILLNLFTISRFKKRQCVS